jgi:hypothetical protein
MRNWFLICFLIITLNVNSQNGNIIFNDTIVHTLVIETTIPNWFETVENDFQQNFDHPDLYPEIYRPCSVSWDGILLSNCGFREKGNASNSLTNFGKKKPFKIAFDEFDNNQTLDGLKKINLNNFTNDPSLMHDVISFKLFRDAGLVASRTSYAKLIINGEYIGLYVIIENVDKTFLKAHYGGANNDGNLYKTDRGAAVYLNWLGSSSSGYKDQGLKLNTNDSIDDWTQLINFIDFINNNFDADFKQQLESKFDVHAYLKILAIEKCVRSWDSYWGGGNNFYLYEHPDGMIRWIPWDMNETFQDIKIISGTSQLDGYLVPTNKFDVRPLVKRIFEIPEFKTEYLNYVCELVNSNYSLKNLGQYIVDRHDLVDRPYLEDPYRYNSYEAFKNSLTEYNQDEVSITHSGYVLRLNYPGIFPFIQSQREWAVEQINAWEMECNIEDHSIYDLFVYPNPASDYIQINNLGGGFEYAQFLLYDFTGRICRKTDFEIMEGESYRFFLDGIPGGIYILLKNSADGKLGRAKIIVR